MIEEMEISWLPAPELESSARAFEVTLRNEPLFVGADERWTSYVRELPLDVRQKRALVVLLGRKFKSGEYQTLNRVDRDTAYRELADLVTRGLLVPAGAGAATRYAVVKPAALTSTPTTPKAKLIARMNAAAKLTNTDYREAFGVEREAAKQGLFELVREGVLELRGARRGSHYVPGAQWAGFSDRG